MIFSFAILLLLRRLRRKHACFAKEKLQHRSAAAPCFSKDFLHHYQLKSPAFPLPAQKPLWYMCMQAYLTEYPFDPPSKGLIAFFWGSTTYVILLCNLDNWRKCQSLWNLKIISPIVTDSIAIKIWPHLFHLINELVIANHFLLEWDYRFINCTISWQLSISYYFAKRNDILYCIIVFRPRRILWQQGKYYPTINSSERRKKLLFGVRLALELEHIAIVIELITVKKPLDLRKILHLFIIQFT